MCENNKSVRDERIDAIKKMIEKASDADVGVIYHFIAAYIEDMKK